MEQRCGISVSRIRGQVLSICMLALLVKINADIQPVVRMRDVIASLEKTGTEAETGSPEDFSRLVRSEIELWSRLVKERNIKVVE